MRETSTARTVCIECPLGDGDVVALVRERSGEVDVSLRFEDDVESVPSMLPRFLGDRCQFVPSATTSRTPGGDDLEFWTTTCPLHPDNTETTACFLLSEDSDRTSISG